MHNYFKMHIKNKLKMHNYLTDDKKAKGTKKQEIKFKNYKNCQELNYL